MDPLTALPVETLTAIALYLHPRDLSKLIRTCKHLSVVVTPLLWSDIEAHERGHHESNIEHGGSPPFRSPSQRFYRVSPFNFFAYMRRTMRYLDHSRLRIVATRVKNLSIFMVFGTESFNQLAHFTNLETLELEIFSDSEKYNDTYMADNERPPLPKLRFAKMCGYLPYQLVKWVLGSTSTLERIEVGILDRSMLTYSGFLHRGWPPIPQILADFIPNGLETLITRVWGMTTICILERTHGHHMLRRPGIDYLDDTPQRSMMNLSSGSGSKALVDMLESTILDKQGFPALEKVYLYGIVVRRGPNGKPEENTPGGRLMRRLEQRGVACEAMFGTWTSYNYRYGSAGWVHNYKQREGRERVVYLDELVRWDSVLAKV